MIVSGYHHRTMYLSTHLSRAWKYPGGGCIVRFKSSSISFNMSAGGNGGGGGAWHGWGPVHGLSRGHVLGSPLWTECQTDRHNWKHYLPATLWAGGHKVYLQNTYCLVHNWFSVRVVIRWRQLKLAEVCLQQQVSLCVGTVHSVLIHIQWQFFRQFAAKDKS